MEISRLNLPQCAVGEGPVWDVQSQSLYWIDIVGQKLHKFDAGTEEIGCWDMPNVICSMALREGGGAIVALADGVYTLDFENGVCEMLATHPVLSGDIQLADGKVDRSGRFIVGAGHKGMSEPLGKLFALDPGASELRIIDEDIILANGPCWSPNNELFYHADSVRQTIFVYDYDLETGTVSGRRVFATTEELGGIPDGATVDSEGHIWSAICEGAKIIRFRPDGSIERIVDFPQKLPGSVMFGGPKLDRLYVPTLSPAFMGREADPNDGCMFMIENLAVTGIEEPRFAG